MATKVTWVLIADGARARLLVNTGRGTGLKPALDQEFIGDKRQSRELTSDKPGRTFDRGGQGRHSMEPPTDPHRHEQHMFARSLADLFEEKQKHNAFDRLIVVAPPKTLGDLRAEFPKAVADLVSDELNKDLTKIPIHELPDHLSELIRL
ncbi:MAG: host attachment protein [Fimbriimonadaceae bacterium]|nr:host attachment protein [Alphaproteobacteria bacterium]